MDYEYHIPVDEELQDIYQGVLGNLMICPGHRPKGVPLPPVSSLISLLNPELTSEQIISLVRERLNQQLSGSKEIDSDMRKKLVKLFCIQTSKYRCEDYVDLWPFLDSVLDESVEELETHVVFQGAEPNANLISVIAKRSPFLKKLKLNFKFYSASRRSSQERITLINSLDGLDSLHHLTSLTLYHLASSYSQSILAIIGENCSSLTHLRLVKTNDFISKHDILAIMLGELLDPLVRPLEHLLEERPFLRFKEVDWFKDAALSRLRVPSEFLTSLCFTLRHLEVSEYAGRQNSNSAIHPEIVAFVLRHMPNLEVLENFTSTEKAVHLLRRETGETERNLTGPIQLGFEQACRDAIYHRGLAQPKSREPVYRPSSTFSGTLSLTKLEYVNLTDENAADVLRAIRLTCPHLRNVSIGEKKKEGLTSPPSKRALMDAEEHQQLKLELSEWPKLEGVTFAKVSPANVHAILNVFHANLKELSFIECSEINLADLKRCTQLQSLRISSTCSVGLYDNVHALSADTFLPNLKSLSCKICLGNKSSLFENKTTLIRLHLKCCHMDIKVFQLT